MRDTFTFIWDYISERKWLLALLPLFFVVLFFLAQPLQTTGQLSTSNFHYTGGLKAGVPNGEGTLTYTNGDRYTGNFSDGKFQGKGNFISKSGKWQFSGNFSDGQADGKGTMTLPDGKSKTVTYRSGVIAQ